MKRILTTIALALLAELAMFADEGMWMVNAISEALAQRIEAGGFELGASEIYDADKVSLSDAIVSLDFGCTGSMISEKGLLITNHHCAYADVHALSTAQDNYLRDGFWAYSMESEIPIPGKNAYFLKKVIDVTDEVAALKKEYEQEGKPLGSRKLSYLIEQKYEKTSGLSASLSSMWAGSRYFLALYKVYTDLRLVAAPPESIAAFGGDIDNWEWPQHKCDFAMYRIYCAPDGSPADYSEDNVPMTPQKYLPICMDGYAPGSFAMVMGYPGRTDRYSSSAKLEDMMTSVLPLTNEIRSAQMEIIKSWMAKDPSIRLKYADKFFSLSNLQENQEGLEECCGRFGVVKSKKCDEKKLLRGKQGRTLRKALVEKYKMIDEAEHDKLVFRETIVRGSALSLVAMRLKNRHNGELDMEKEYEGLDLRVEKDLIRYNIETFFENVSPERWGAFQKSCYERFGKDYDTMTDWLWTDEYLTADCNLARFLNDEQISAYNKVVSDIEGDVTTAELNREFTQMMYERKESRGILQYPDANSTMRLTWGEVGSFLRDGVELPWQTNSKEILEKEDESSFDFKIKPEWHDLLEKSEPVPVNFLTDNDITGGNSGSPVIDGKGRIIGLAFDGNKESLASDVRWVEGYCKCVCVDIRFVIWTLRNYARMDNIIEELGLQQQSQAL